MNVREQPLALGEIRFLTGSRKGETFQITSERISIGRQPDNTNDLILPEGNISRHHAEIIWEDGTWRVNKLSANNSVFIDKREVLQSGNLSSGNVIRLGPEVEVLFQSYMPEKTFDPGTAPTLYNSPPLSNVGESQEELPSLLSDDPFKNPGHSIWQVVGIITSLSGIITVIESIIQSEDLAKKVQIITAVITFCLCAILVLRARPVTPSRKDVQQTKFPAKRVFSYSLWINITLIIVSAFAIIFVSSLESSSLSDVEQQALNVLSISLIVLLAGILISFINFVVQMFSLFLKKLLTGARVLRLSAVSCGITFVLTVVSGFFLTNVMTIAELVIVGVLVSVGIMFLESLLIFIIVGIYMLIALFSRRLSGQL